MLLAIYNLLNEAIITTKNLTVAKEIYEDFLVDKYDTSHSKLKLKPIKDDEAAFKDSNISFGSQFSYNKENFIKSVKISEDIYVNVVLNTEAKLNLLYKIFVEHNIDINELLVTLLDETEL